MESNVSLPSDRTFFANACFVCLRYGENIKLKRCARCKMVAYCDREHQVAHWPDHKPLCKILSGKLNDNGTVYEMVPGSGDETWCTAKTAIITLAQTVLSVETGRGLIPIELEMLAFPRSCEVCHETNFDKLSDCTECPDSSFCSDHPKDSSHSARCELTRFFCDTHHATPCFRNPIASMKYGKRTPLNITEATRLFASYAHSQTDLRLEKIWIAILSDRLSRPYTFLYAMHKLNRPKTPKITIHVVGATPLEMDSVYFWHYLLHHDKSIRELCVIFVGVHLASSVIDHPPCQQCDKKNLLLTVENINSLYMVYAADKSFKKPDYMIRFNLEVHPTNETWLPTVKILAKLACPLFLTSYSAEKAQKNSDKINQVLGRTIPLFHNENNPFAGTKPYKDFQSEDFYYSNQHLTIYETLS